MNWWCKFLFLWIAFSGATQSFALDVERIEALQKLEPAKRMTGMYLYAQELEQQLPQGRAGAEEQAGTEAEILAQHYNLAILYTQAGERGRAMLHLQRANRLWVEQPLVRQAIQQIQASLPPAEQSHSSLRTLQSIGLNWEKLQLWFASLVLAVTLLWVVLQNFPHAVIKGFLGLSLTGAVVFGLAVGLVLQETYDSSQVVLLQDQSDCRYGPALSFGVVRPHLLAGTLATEEKQKNGWFLLDFAEGEQCWLPQRLVALP